MGYRDLSAGELFFAGEDFKHTDGRGGDAGTGAEDGGYASLIEEVVILGRNHTAGGHHDIVASQLLEFFDYLGNQRLVTGGQRGDAEDMDVVLDSLTGSLGGSLEQRSWPSWPILAIMIRG